MNNKSTITIGIAAYNEENNIYNMLSDLYKQKTRECVIKDIILLCDGCTDKTAIIVKNRFPKVTVIEDPKRIGKTKRLEQLFKLNKNKYIIMLDADIRIPNYFAIERIVKALKTKADLAGGNSKPEKARNFSQRAVQVTYNIFYKSRFWTNHGNNIFGCTGSILGISNSFAKKVKFPPIINEDAYLFLLAKHMKYRFSYVDDAIVTYKLPKRLIDYFKQLIRSEPSNAVTELQPYFHDDAKNAFYRPRLLYFKSICHEFINSPIETITIIFITSSAILLGPLILKNYSLDWFTASSSK